MSYELLDKVKKNLILTHDQDNDLLEHLLAAATSYATSYQHLPEGFYQQSPMSGATEQAILMLTSHFYESRDGSTAGFWNDKPQATASIWEAVNRLLVLDREWKI